jgi:hypothetical protein
MGEYHGDEHYIDAELWMIEEEHKLAQADDDYYYEENEND